MTLLLAPLFETTVGVEADGDMLAEGRRRAVLAGSATIEWRRLRAEELPAGLGKFRLVTFAQSFHWMDQPLVARRLRDMLSPESSWVHVHATTHRGVAGEGSLPYPSRRGIGSRN